MAEVDPEVAAALGAAGLAPGDPLGEMLRLQRSAWAACGVPLHEAVSWARAGVSPTVAAPWVRRGFGRDEALAWKGAGFGAETAAPWREAGVAPDEAAAWANRDRRRGVWHHSPQARAAWVALGASVDDASAALSQGLSQREAIQWAEAGGFTLAQALAMRGLAPADARRYVDAGVSPASARTWALRKVAPEEAAAWEAAGVGPDPAAQWRRAGFTPADAREWAAQGHAPEAARRWRQAGVRDGAAASEAARRRCTPGQAAEAGFGWLPSGEPDLVALVFWGSVLEVAPADLDALLDGWRDRLRAAGEEPEDLGCVLRAAGREGAAPALAYVAVLASEVRRGRMDVLAPAKVERSWRQAVRTFGGALGLELPAPNWTIALRWDSPGALDVYARVFYGFPLPRDAPEELEDDGPVGVGRDPHAQTRWVSVMASSVGGEVMAPQVVGHGFVVDPGWDDALREYCGRHGVAWREPRWHVVPYGV